MVDKAPFTSMDTDFGQQFGTGINNEVAAVLSAVATPLMATVTLWIIIQGILVMRGDLDTRVGVTRIIKAALVVGLLTSSGAYSTYVQTLFTKTLPAWAAQTTNGTAQPVASTPATFDNMWQLTEDYASVIGSQIDPIDFLDALSLGVIEIGIMIILVVTFAVYEFSIIVTGIIVAIGPILVVGYLFEATKGFTDRWIGSLITYSLLTLLINITLNIIISGEKTYFRLITQQLASNNGGSAPVKAEISTLLELAMFLAMGAFIILSLPAIAAAIGGGHHGGSVGHAIMRGISGTASRTARLLNTPLGSRRK